MPEAYASISTSVILEDGPEPVMHVCAWEVPAPCAIQVAAVLNAMFGQPSEMITDPRAAARAGERAAAEDGAVYLLRGGEGETSG